MFRKFLLLVIAATLAVCVPALSSVPAFAQEEGAAVSEGAKVDKKKIDDAVKKACDWLKSRQKPDGSWTGEKRQDKVYPYASTAFVLYALLKGTEGPDSECIKKGFDYLSKKGFPSVYGVSALILALCALCEPEPIPEEEPRKLKPGEKLRTGLYDSPEKRAKKKLKKASPQMRDWLKKAVAWLVKSKHEEVWRYPGAQLGDFEKYPACGGNADASNTQYAMLALHAASRLGINAPREVYVTTAKYFIREQEKDGPEVKPAFPVPAADLPIKKLKELEKAMLKKLREEAIQAAKEDQPVPVPGPRTSLGVDDPYKEFGAEITPMKARGWAYLPPNALNSKPWMFKATGSMTTSGISSLIICKANLEGTGWYKKNKKKLHQAIRDGMAWLAYNFTVTGNPKLDIWKYYYLYGLERSGVLALSRKIGEHFWYEEGANHILSTQNSGGWWPGAGGGETTFYYDPTWPTCFAILFLKRATAPIVTVNPTYTGKDLFGPGKKEQDK